MRRRLLIILGIICLFGTTLAIFSTLQHFRLAKTGFEEQSFCVISDEINCDLVNGSSYSEFLGVPVAWWGTIYYSLLALMCFFAAFSRKKRKATVSIAWFMAMAGIPYCIYLAYAAFFIIGAVCIECIGMYTVNLIAAIGLFFTLRIPLSKAFSYVWNYLLAFLGKPNNLGFKHRVWGHILIIGLVFAIGWIAILKVQAGQEGPRKSRMSLDERIRAHYVQSIHPIEISKNWAVWGNPNAKVKLVEFSEFQCPFCRLAAFTVKPYLQEFHKDIAYYFVNYPLDSECNPAVSRPMHPLACYLAKAGICANNRGDFWKYHDELFRNQKKFSQKLALDLAENKFGWDRDEFLQCINSEETNKELSSEIETGRRIYLTGTPSLFLNGRRIKNWKEKKFLQALVKEEIKR
jgi:protein-disulfide isomerase/uncharacterized membrane protein